MTVLIVRIEVEPTTEPAEATLAEQVGALLDDLVERLGHEPNRTLNVLDARVLREEDE